MTQHADQEFHLLGAPSGAESSPPCLAVPAGVSYLSGTPEQVPRLTQEPSLGRPAFVLEPVAQNRQAHLLLLSAYPHRPFVNGLPAPRVVLLRDRDSVRFDDQDQVLHVALYHRPRVGPPPEELLGKECPVCRLPFEAGATVYRCRCGAAIHHEANTAGRDGALECLQLSPDCPVCNAPVVLSQGYAHVPEF